MIANGFANDHATRPALSIRNCNVAALPSPLDR